MPTRAVAKDYAAIAAKRIQKPSQQESKMPSMLIYGRNKKGKSRFCITSKGLILDPEHGTDRFTRRDPDVWHIDNWEDVDEAYKFLRYGRHDYQWACLDGLTRFSNMALRWVMHQAEEHDLSRRPGQVQQRDYGKAGEIMKGMMYNFHSLPGMSIIYTAQERQIDGDFGEEDEDSEDVSIQYVPDLPKGVRSTVNQLVDVIGRIYTVKIEKDEGSVIQRRLWLEPSIMYDTGYRSEYVLPAFLKNPTVPRLVKLIQEGSSNG